MRYQRAVAASAVHQTLEQVKVFVLVGLQRLDRTHGFDDDRVRFLPQIIGHEAFVPAGVLVTCITNHAPVNRVRDHEAQPI